MATSPSERQQILSQINTLAVRDLVALWRSGTKYPGEDFPRFMTDGLRDVADPWAAVAAEMAANWYDDSAPALAFTATPTGMPDVNALNESASWALGAPGDAALVRLAGTLQRTVFGAARDTIVDNVNSERDARWARHASANACEFCRLLASRGAVYGTRDRAMKSHDHCHCVAIEVRPGASYEPAPYVERFEQEYIAARKAAGSGNLKTILAAWRQLPPTS